MQTSNTLALMQSVATLALMLSLSFAYLINPLEDSIFFSVLNSFSKSLYDSNVINELNTSVIAGIIIGLFLGTTNILLSSSKKVYNYVLISLVSLFTFIFIGYVFSVEGIPYEPLQQLFFWVLVGLPVSTGMVGIWQNKIGNQAVSYTHLTLPTT